LNPSCRREGFNHRLADSEIINESSISNRQFSDGVDRSWQRSNTKHAGNSAAPISALAATFPLAPENVTK
jgi:hypothetical protein